MQWLTSGECPLNNGPELAVEHPNSNLKIHIVAHDNMWLIKSNYRSINAYTRLESPTMTHFANNQILDGENVELTLEIKKIIQSFWIAQQSTENIVYSSLSFFFLIFRFLLR